MSSNKLILVYISCWIFGIAGFAFALYSGFTGQGPTGETLIVSQSENFFIRYSLQLMMVSISVGIIICPILLRKGYLGPKECNIDRYDKAKGEFIISSFTYLGLFFAFLGGAHIGKISTTGKLIAVVFFFHYLYVVAKLLKFYFNENSQPT